MNCCFFNSSLGKKVVMALTGLILFGFVLAHMLGNLQIFMGRQALNDYAEHLANLPYLLWPARLTLLSSLIAHVLTAICLTRENRKARPVPYANSETLEASYASRTMMMSGIIVFLFIVYHLLHFTLGVVHHEAYLMMDEKGRHDVYSMVVLSFQNIWVSISYVIAMAALCFHLSHGLRSFPQSLGVNTQKNIRVFNAFAVAFSWLIFLGNSSIPLAVLSGLIKLPGVSS